MPRALLLFAVLSLAFAPAPFPKPKKELKTVKLKSGLEYKDLKIGAGAQAKKGDTLLVHYIGWLAKNKVEFDSSAGKEPLAFKLGAGRVIKGWDEGMEGMKVGGKRKLMIPSNLAYGKTARGPIPANAGLIFEVELLEIRAMER